MRSKLLGQLVSDCPHSNLVVKGLSDDSRFVSSGDVFIAVKGANADGHQFVQDAKGKGAVAILTERPISLDGLPVIIVPELREKRGSIAAKFFEYPSSEIICCGVTGTNGKTSIAHYISALASELKVSSRYLGTLGYGVLGKLKPSFLTTPGPVIIQRIIRDFVDEGAAIAAIEVSSHALDQGRVNEVDFDLAIFSNLSHDHLDYHQNFEAYGEAKARLFKGETLSTAIINTDDKFSKNLMEILDPRVDCITYGQKGEVRWSDLNFLSEGIIGKWTTPWGCADFQLAVGGEFSVANMAAAISTLCSQGHNFEEVIYAASRVSNVPGRMEFFRSEGSPTVVVDYAHTPDALEKVLVAARKHTKGRLGCLLGCGGDRDTRKRPIMAAIAERIADDIWFTTDNSRSEDPWAIIDNMCCGLIDKKKVNRFLDRSEAIRSAIKSMKEIDLLVVAGRGHETHQDISGELVPFDDREYVSQVIEEVN
tara:strand:- start:1230 stop:2669 length:1440 start_codon:yes stop_codon:yes gene_type:complete